MPEEWYPPEFDELGPKASACGEAGGCTGSRVGPLRIVMGPGQLDVLARARYRPTTGPYAQGMAMYLVGRATEARAAAERAVASVAETARRLAAPIVAPWITRAKLGKSGKLYTLGDLQRNVIRNNQAVNRAKEKAQIKAARASKLAKVLKPLRHLRFAAGGPGLGPPPLTDLYAELVALDIHEQRMVKRRRAQSLSTNRTGAGASRSTTDAKPRSNTNRTGAGSTRPLGTGTVTPFPQPAKPGAARTSGGRVGEPPVILDESGATIPRESEGSREARRKMEQTRKLPGVLQLPRSRQSFPDVRLGFPSMQQLLSRVSTPPRVRTRLPTRTSASSPTRTSSQPALTSLTAPTFGTGLTPLNMQGVGSQFREDPCKCEKPKRKKRSGPSCSNPLISRTVKDGVVTTRRKLKCPPSSLASARGEN